LAEHAPAHRRVLSFPTRRSSDLQRAGVARVGLELLLLHDLDDRRRRAQGEEHGEDQHAHAAEFLVHAAPPPSTTACGCWRTASDNRSSSATMSQLATSEEPPAARNGVVRPVSGMMRVTPPITMNTCSPTANERPTASRRPKSS